MRAVVVIAVIALAAAMIVAALPSPAIDWTSVLRFIAPNAFEIRSIEEIIEAGRP